MTAEEIALKINARECDLLKGTKLIEQYARNQFIDYVNSFSGYPEESKKMIELYDLHNTKQP